MTLERCINFIRTQTANSVGHILVANGYPQQWIDDLGLRHIKLDCGHGDSGNMPRVVGCLVVAAEEYDAIVLVEANFYFSVEHLLGRMADERKQLDCASDPPLGMVFINP